MPRKAKTVREKLASARRDGDCLIWSGASGRYGHININGKTRLAHRVAWETFIGPIPKGLFVCHTCDNPYCVSIGHLFLGTHQDNMDDMKRKGRAAAGDNHGSRLHPEARLRGDNHPLRRDPSRAARGLNNGAYTQPHRVRRGVLNGCAKLTPPEIVGLCGKYITGSYSQRQIAKEYGVHQHTVWEILQGRTWHGSIA